MLHHLCTLVLMIGFVGCADALVSEHRSERTSENEHTNRHSFQNLSAEGETTDESPQFGKGEVVLNNGSNHSIPRCGASNDLHLSAMKRLKDKWKRTRDLTSEFDINVTPDIEISGVDGASSVRIQTDFEAKNINIGDKQRDYHYFSYDSGKIYKNERFGYKRLTSLFDWDGERLYTYVKRQKMANGELKHVPGWGSIDCSVIAVTDAVWYHGANRYDVTYDPPLPKLLVPNAAKSVYVEELKEPLYFKTTASLVVYKYPTNNVVTSPVEVSDADYNKGDPSVREFEMKLTLTSVTGPVVTVRIEPVFRTETGRQLTDSAEVAKLLLEARHWGMLPSMEYTIDTDKRQVVKLQMKIPYDRISAFDEDQRVFTGNFDFKPQ